jgi:hypothetical protein
LQSSAVEDALFLSRCKRRKKEARLCTPPHPVQHNYLLILPLLPLEVSSTYLLTFSNPLPGEKIVARQIVVLSAPQSSLEVMAGSSVKKLEKGTGRTRIWNHLALLMWMGGIHVNFFVAGLILTNLRSTWAIT